MPHREPHQATPEDMAEMSTDGKVWPFDEVLDYRVYPEGLLQLCIQWNGPYEPNWEPRTHVHEEAIAKYFYARWRKENSEK